MLVKGGLKMLLVCSFLQFLSLLDILVILKGVISSYEVGHIGLSSTSFFNSQIANLNNATNLKAKNPVGPLRTLVASTHQSEFRHRLSIMRFG